MDIDWNNWDAEGQRLAHEMPPAFGDRSLNERLDRFEAALARIEGDLTKGLRVLADPHQPSCSASAPVTPFSRSRSASLKPVTR